MTAGLGSYALLRSHDWRDVVGHSLRPTVREVLSESGTGDEHWFGSPSFAINWARLSLLDVPQPTVVSWPDGGSSSEQGQAGPVRTEEGVFFGGGARTTSADQGVANRVLDWQVSAEKPVENLSRLRQSGA